ncbi:hypothetical protein EBU24_01130 [bacterium]|nr:hypothetical protein [bacterium]
MAGTLKDPIQTFSIQESVQFYDNGRAKTYLFNISVSAKIVANQLLSIENKKSYILARQIEIMNQFKNYSSDSTEYFEVQPRDGTQPFKFIPRVKNITFKEDVWVDFCDYTIEMEADSIYIGSSGKIPSNPTPSDIDESWSVDYNQEDLRFTKVNHKISAKSKSIDSQKGWEISRTEVLKKINDLIPTDIKDKAGNTYVKDSPSNKLINYSVNVLAGEFSAEINLTYHNDLLKNSIIPQLPQAHHEQTITDKQSGETLRDSLSIEGTITGLSSSSTSTPSNRYTEAFALWTTVKDTLNDKYSNLIITSFSETHDKVKGVITYNYEIENTKKPANEVKNETITINYFGPLANPLNTYVIHNTIFGNKGPVFQNINTNKAKTMSVTIERVGTEAIPDTLTEYQPIGSMIESDTINFNAQNKKISRTTVFIWADGSTPNLPDLSNFDLINTQIPRPY